MKKLLIYSTLILFCCGIGYQSKSCNVSVADIQLKQKTHVVDIDDIHPLSIFSFKY